MEEKFISMRDGKKIYSRIYNNNYKDTVFYLHGGLGGNCTSFQYTAYKLADYMNVILIDQRGNLRSEKLFKNDKCKVDMLVDDIEDIRKYLNIDKMIMLGQSFGGTLGLLYATRYPKYVDKIIFENPTFDFNDAMKTLYKKAINIFEENNKAEEAENFKNILKSNKDTKFLMTEWLKVSDDLKEKVYHMKSYSRYSEEQKMMSLDYAKCDDVYEDYSLPLSKLMEDKKMYKNSISLIKNLKCEALLMRGEFDPILSDEYREYYIDNIPKGNIITVNECGHFIHTDKVDEYVDIIRDFIDIV